MDLSIIIFTLLMITLSIKRFEASIVRKPANRKRKIK